MRNKIFLILLLAESMMGAIALARGADALAQQPIGYTELIINGDMEGDEGWTFPVTAVQGGYSTDRYFSPVRSARLGIVSGENKYAYSSMNQSVDIPALAPGGSLVLRWIAFALSQPPDSHDFQYVQIRDAAGTLHTIWRGSRNDAQWLSCSYDVSAYAGQRVVLYWGVMNDGWGGTTAMYVDDVSLMLSNSAQNARNDCTPISVTPTPITPTVTPSLTSTPVPAFTPTPTPSPTPCRQLIQNPGFDDDYDHWTQNLYLTAPYLDETGQEHEGAWFGGAEYVHQYLYQDATIPAGSPAARLSLLWAFDPAEGLSSGDALTITLRNADDALLTTLQIIDKDSAPRRWQTAEFDLSPYIGETVRFHAQATTTDAVSSWYLDDIQLHNCASQGRATYLPWVVKK